MKLAISHFENCTHLRRHGSDIFCWSGRAKS